MKDWRVIHEEQVRRERRAFIEAIDITEARAKAARKEYPEGSVWLWGLAGMYGPVGSEDKDRS